MQAVHTLNTRTHRVQRHPALQREQEVLFVEDVMEILQIGQSLAYKIMRQLNNELAAEGYIVIAGRVPTAKFRERIYSGAATETRRAK